MAQPPIPTLNLVGWSVLDFELAYDGLTHMADAVNGVICQPRAMMESDNYFPGAAVLESVIVRWIDYRVADLMGRLRTIHFDVGGEEDRRILLLLKYQIDCNGMKVPELVHFALDQAVRAAG
jgi:hypothetical protein